MLIYQNIGTIYLCPVAIWLNGSPSSSQVKDGVGEPVAEHRRDTGGPGRNACSINVYCSSGTVSKKNFQISIFLNKNEPVF